MHSSTVIVNYGLFGFFIVLYRTHQFKRSRGEIRAPLNVSLQATAEIYGSIRHAHTAANRFIELFLPGLTLQPAAGRSVPTAGEGNYNVFICLRKAPSHCNGAAVYRAPGYAVLCRRSFCARCANCHATLAKALASPMPARELSAVVRRSRNARASHCFPIISACR